LARKHLGERVAQGRKRGFTIPVQRWMVGRWRPAVEELFRESLLEREGWVRAAPVLQQLRQSVAGGIAPVQLWYLYALESWLRYERTEQLEPAQVHVN
jgi:asparagine synthase (glutamine-hydrolysing)